MIEIQRRNILVKTGESEAEYSMLIKTGESEAEYIGSWRNNLGSIVPTEPLVNVAFISAVADGSLSVTTTKVTLTFSQNITGLDSSDITLDPGSTGAVKGSLTNIGTGVYELALDGIEAGGGVVVEVSRAGYSISPSSQNVAVNYYASSSVVVADFVAVMAGTGTTNQVRYSLDNGVTWSFATIPAAGAVNWAGVCYGEGKGFVAVAGRALAPDVAFTGGATDVAAFSADGVTWEKVALPSSQSWTSCAYGNGVFVAVSGGSANSTVAAWSENGKSWTQVGIPSGRWNKVNWAHDAFYATSAGSSLRPCRSEDGKSWNLMTAGISQASGWSGVVYNGVAYVVGDEANGNPMYSTNGTTWTRVNLGDVWADTIFAANGTKVICIGTSVKPNISTGTHNGATWSGRPANPILGLATGNVSHVAYSGGKYILVTSVNNPMLQSVNPTISDSDWATVSGVSNAAYNGICGKG